MSLKGVRPQCAQRLQHCHAGLTVDDRLPRFAVVVERVAHPALDRASQRFADVGMVGEPLLGAERLKDVAQWLRAVFERNPGELRVRTPNRWAAWNDSPVTAADVDDPS